MLFSFSKNHVGGPHGKTLLGHCVVPIAARLDSLSFRTDGGDYTGSLLLEIVHDQKVLAQATHALTPHGVAKLDAIHVEPGAELAVYVHAQFSRRPGMMSLASLTRLDAWLLLRDASERAE